MKLINILLATALTGSLQAKDVIEESEFCRINWSDGYVMCNGESAEDPKAYNAKRAAVVIAQRNLLELVKGVNIDSQTTVKDGMLQSDVIKSSVSGMVKGAVVTANIYNKKDQVATATLKIHLGKDLLNALSNNGGGNDGKSSGSNVDEEFTSQWIKKLEHFAHNFLTPTQLNAKETYSLNDQKTIDKLIADFKESKDNVSLQYLEEILKNIKTKNYSGLLVDAREVSDLKPALTIKLVDKEGKEIYPGKLVDKSAFIGKNGVSVGLDFDIKEAKNNKRIFDTPLELTGISTYKKRKSDIVLSDEDVKKIQVVIAAMKKAKVIVVVPE